MLAKCVKILSTFCYFVSKKCLEKGHILNIIPCSDCKNISSFNKTRSDFKLDPVLNSTGFKLLRSEVNVAIDIQKSKHGTLTFLQTCLR